MPSPSLGTRDAEGSHNRGSLLGSVIEKWILVLVFVESRNRTSLLKGSRFDDNQGQDQNNQNGFNPARLEPPPAVHPSHSSIGGQAQTRFRSP